MIKFGIGIKVTGKTLTQLNHDLRIETTGIRNDVLEKIRQQLMREAPRKSKGNKFSQNRIYNYLSKPSNCIRKRGRFGGYVILDSRKLPHLKYLVSDTRGKIYPKRANMLFFVKPSGEKVWAYWVKGYKANTFIKRAYVRSRKPIHYVTWKHLHKVLYKR